MTTSRLDRYTCRHCGVARCCKDNFTPSHWKVWACSSITWWKKKSLDRNCKRCPMSLVTTHTHTHLRKRSKGDMNVYTHSHKHAYTDKTR